MKLTLVKKIQQANYAISFLFKTDEQFIWKSGQYLRYILPHLNPDNRGYKRYFTISTAPHEKMIGLTTRFAREKGSSFKETLHNLQIGDIVEAGAPDGDFVVDKPNEKYIFIAGGIGITPYRAILLDLAHKSLPINVTLFYANKTNDFVFKKELESLVKDHHNFKIYYFVSPKRIEEKTIKRKVFDLTRPIFCISGPAPMVFSFEEMLQKMGVAENKIKIDDFPGYTW